MCFVLIFHLYLRAQGWKLIKRATLNNNNSHRFNILILISSFTSFLWLRKCSGPDVITAQSVSPAHELRKTKIRGMINNEGVLMKLQEHIH